MSRETIDKVMIEKTIELLREDKKYIEESKNVVCPEIDMAIEALEYKLNNRWIPVSERLPDESGDCLVTYGNGKVMTHWYIDELKCWLNKIWVEQVGGIVGWRQLPEPMDNIKEKE